jgi:hypothetical protein
VADEENGRGGWLPPRAPGAEEPPRYEPGESGTPRWQPPAPDAEPSRWVATEGWSRPPAGETPAPTAPERRPTFTTDQAHRDIAGTSAMTLAIISLALLVFSIGVGFWLTLPLSGLAMYLGRRARARGDAAQVRAGRSQAHAGHVLGVVGVVLGVIAAVGWIVASSLGYSPADLQHDLQRELDQQTGEAIVLAARALIGR